jgi:YidC/Oxa1 family membrane protein insertase
MELRRSLILGALFGIAFLLWTTWQQEHPPVDAATPSLATTVQAGSLAPMVLPEQQSVPQIAAAVLPEKQQVNTADLIQIKTDVLELTVSPLGGDIIGSRLLQYPQSHGAEKTPLVLFNDDPNSRYLAKSGLIDPQGKDLLREQGILFTSVKPTYEMVEGENTLKVILQAQARGLQINKIITLERNSYVIKITYEIVNQTATPWQGNAYFALQRKNMPQAKNSFHTFFGIAISSPDDPYEKIKLPDLEKTPLQRAIKGGWAAMIEHYFLTAWIPEAENTYQYYSRVLADQNYAVGMLSPKLEIATQARQQLSASLYVGPAITEYLAAVAPHLDLTVDYGFLWFISSVLMWLMKKIHALVGNWGWSIVLVTVIIKLMFYQLSAKSYRSMARMRDLQPKMQVLKERFGDDKQGFSRATMDLYKREKVNPLGGCLPILVQIPVFLGLYWALLESVEFRQSPFIGWIVDLSTQDPYYVLPLLMGASMFVQQKMTPAPPDPIQAKVMMLMPVIFTVFFLTFPAGLVLYWLVNNTLSILQQWWITKTMHSAKTAIVTKTKK